MQAGQPVKTAEDTLYPPSWQKGHAGLQKVDNKSGASWEADAQTPANPAAQLTQTYSISLGPASKGKESIILILLSTLSLFQQFNLVEVKPEMVGHYTGEFSISYQPVKHGRPGQSGLFCQACPTCSNNTLSQVSDLPTAPASFP